MVSEPAHLPLHCFRAYWQMGTPPGTQPGFGKLIPPSGAGAGAGAAETLYTAAAKTDTMAKNFILTSDWRM